jgi:hypothetical protein
MRLPWHEVQNLDLLSGTWLKAGESACPTGDLFAAVFEQRPNVDEPTTARQQGDVVRVPTQPERRCLALLRRLARAGRWALPELVFVDRPRWGAVAKEPERIIGVGQGRSSG